MSKKKVFLAIMLVICLTSFVSSVALYSQRPRLGEKYQVALMVSEGMEPTIMRGSLVVADKTVKPSEIVASPAPDGDIIMFYRPRAYKDLNDIVVHRAINKSYDGDEDKWYFKTQGDNNLWPPVWDVSEDYLIGKVVDVNLQLFPLVWSLLLSITVAIAIVTGVSSLVLVVLTRRKGK